MGSIILAATPLGNIGDASARLRELLSTADVVAAEDTRTLAQLARALGITIQGRTVAHHEHNEAHSAPELVRLAAEGSTVVMVSDAGMPLVSDPGFRLVQAAVAAGVDVTCAPGPSAVTTALALSGLPSDRFAFDGFVPRKEGERRRWLSEVAEDPRTLVFFESPHRLAATLQTMSEVFGPDRSACVCRELTKLHEEVVRDDLAGLAEWAGAGTVRGEIVIVVQGHQPDQTAPDLETLVSAVEERVSAGEKLKSAVKEVAATAPGVATRDLYNAVLARREA